MNPLTRTVYNWLVDSEENSAAEFLKECSIENIYVDTAFGIHNDQETSIYAATVSVPAHLYKNLRDHESEQQTIERAINDTAMADNVFVNEISWRPRLRNGVDTSVNQITAVTRRNIVDEVVISNIPVNGRLSEPDFLSRLFDLKNMPSSDTRYDNALEDINKHTILNADWDSNWMFVDSRLNLIESDDAFFLKFLAETVHPFVRSDDRQVTELIAIYNKHLFFDGYELVEAGNISGKSLFRGNRLGNDAELHNVRKKEIKRFLNTDYVNAKVKLMHKSLENDTDLAIGTAKELIETICFSILRTHKVTIDIGWTLPRLMKEATHVLDIKPKDASAPEQAEKSVKQILGGISSVVHGIGELRNAYGSGHGKEAAFKGLEAHYAKLVVGLVSEISIFYLTINGATSELIEEII